MGMSGLLQETSQGDQISRGTELATYSQDEDKTQGQGPVTKRVQRSLSEENSLCHLIFVTKF